MRIQYFSVCKPPVSTSVCPDLGRTNVGKIEDIVISRKKTRKPVTAKHNTHNQCVTVAGRRGRCGENTTDTDKIFTEKWPVVITRKKYEIKLCGMVAHESGIGIHVQSESAIFTGCWMIEYCCKNLRKNRGMVGIEICSNQEPIISIRVNNFC